LGRSEPLPVEVTVSGQASSGSSSKYTYSHSGDATMWSSTSLSRFRIDRILRAGLHGEEGEHVVAEPEERRLALRGGGPHRDVAHVDAIAHGREELADDRVSVIVVEQVDLRHQRRQLEHADETIAESELPDPSVGGEAVRSGLGERRLRRFDGRLVEGELVAVHAPRHEAGSHHLGLDDLLLLAAAAAGSQSGREQDRQQAASHSSSSSPPDGLGGGAAPNAGVPSGSGSSWSSVLVYL
jgi:hypothetical protein